MTTTDQPTTARRPTTAALTYLALTVAIAAITIGIPALVAAGPIAVLLGAITLTAIYVLTGRWTR
ncbi:hypothetical protein GRS96_12530 [Rathayibacter sp. VKM Ac-2803]|uniref:hypothetical protein n=1 Tax=Rathayibacter sp. VKM Ac-2803 TaxID=2609256 RepID=UPI00135B6E53|nr:hypothetical protein [Rathayibacter sp. VKM Ac-2803]MWV50095.1 hypothetical protein [Rathayibacter sp. VKM Ac-2803]